jgi:hypothetical protein
LTPIPRGDIIQKTPGARRPDVQTQGGIRLHNHTVI